LLYPIVKKRNQTVAKDLSHDYDSTFIDLIDDLSILECSEPGRKKYSLFYNARPINYDSPTRPIYIPGPG